MPPPSTSRAQSNFRFRCYRTPGSCAGFLHADGYAGFDRLYRPTTPAGEPRLIEVACWAHVRRKFYDVHHATASPIALEALERIAALFVIEDSVNGQAPIADAPRGPSMPRRGWRS